MIAYDSNKQRTCDYCNKPIERSEAVSIIGKGEILLIRLKGSKYRPDNLKVRHKRCQQQAQANKANWGQAR